MSLSSYSVRAEKTRRLQKLARERRDAYIARPLRIQVAHLMKCVLHRDQVISTLREKVESLRHEAEERRRLHREKLF